MSIYLIYTDCVEDAVAYGIEHWTMKQKVACSSFIRAGSWETPPVHPAACGYLTLAWEG